MTTLSFYARGDGSNANNAALNVDSKSQQPTVQITFDSGAGGDIVLDGNGGSADPDTTVIIDGVSYNFIVEQTGDLPFGNNKVPDVLEGSQITVISVVIDGNYERFFFVTDGSGTFALMEQFGNGAVPLTNVDTSPGAVFICFCGGTDILTATGNRKVETLRPGDLVVTDTGAEVPILWVGQSRATVADMARDPARRPVRIAAHSLAPGMPYRDLYVSAQHRVVLDSAWAELYFGEPGVMVPARFLVGVVAQWSTSDRDVSYFHILLDHHGVLSSNGLPTESFQPSARSFEGISPQMRRSMSNAVPRARLRALFAQPDAMRTLKQFEAELLVEQLFPAVGHDLARAA